MTEPIAGFTVSRSPDTHTFAWEIQGVSGSVLARSAGMDYGTREECQSAFDLVRTHLASAPIVPLDGSGWQRFPLWFEIEHFGAGYGWSLQTSKRHMGSSTEYAGVAEATAAAEALRAAAAAGSLIELRASCTYRIRDIGRWGQPITLELTSGTFGTGGEVHLGTEDGSEIVRLEVLEWERDAAVVAQLPSVGFGDGRYGIALTGVSAPPVPLPIEPFVFFEVVPSPSAWGAPVTLRALGGTFGNRPGRVLLRGINPEPIFELTPLQWSAANVVVMLPPVPPVTSSLYVLRVEAMNIWMTFTLTIPLPPPPPVVPWIDTALTAMLDPMKIHLVRVQDGRVSALPPEVEVTWASPRLALKVQGIERTIIGPANETLTVYSRFVWPLDTADRKQVRPVPGEEGADVVFAFAPRFARHRVSPTVLPDEVRMEIVLTVEGSQPVMRSRSQAVKIRAVHVPAILALCDRPHLGQGREAEDRAAWYWLISPTAPHVECLTEILDALQSARVDFPSTSQMRRVGETADVLAKLVGPEGVLTVAEGEGRVHRTYAAAVTDLSTLRVAPFYSAEDTARSLFFLGMPGQSIELFGARSFSPAEGSVVVAVGIERLLTTLPTLSGNDLASDPPDELSVSAPVFGGTFENSLSSVLFTWPLM